MKRILIADDHSIVRKGLKLILIEEYIAVEIIEACDAESVIKIISNDSNIDLIISDLSMPGRSGLEIIQMIRKNNLPIPVLILSIQPEEQYALRVLRAGAAGYLSKELAPEELVKAVQKVLEGKKYISSSMAERLASLLDESNSEFPHESLTNREFEVFKWLAKGKSVSEIAEMLKLGVTTISTHRKNILTKMNMVSNADITRYAIANNIDC